ncbi:MAG: hypothetical protein K2M73_11415 [Lachnospiraceae bacterium]|nr:hypothetical protein [Lachnospiraceae bacterium]
MKNKDIEKSKKREQRIYRLLVSLLIFLILILFTVFVPILINTIIGIREKDRLNNNISRIKEKYGIDIFYEGNMSEEMECKYKLSDDMGANSKAVSDISVILDRITLDLVRELINYGKGEEYVKGNINIFLCNAMEENIYGQTEFLEDGFTIYIKICDNSVKAIFSHEIFHRIIGYIRVNSWINYDKEDSYMKWKSVLPEGYEYMEDRENYDGESISNKKLQYTYGVENDISNVYFLNSYSQKNQDEDMCDIFAYLLAINEDGELPKAFDSPHVKEKAKLIVDMIAETFDCVDENAYWAKIYREKVE